LGGATKAQKPGGRGEAGASRTRFVKAAFQKDHQFLTDVRRGLNSGQFALWWLGQSGFLVVNEGRAIVFDPYLSDSLTVKYASTAKPHVRLTERVVAPESLAELGVIEAITSSHNHTDHLDAETLHPLLRANPRARLLVPAANRQFVLERLGDDLSPRLVESNDGTTTNINDIEFHGVAAAHTTVERDVHGRCKFLGYVISWGAHSVYHSGDTLLHDRLAPALRGFRVELALLPINGDRPERGVAGNLDGRQAAQLAHDIGAHWVIPCHFDLFEFNTASPDEFVSECQRLGQPYRVLRNGEGWAL
jgi:L-ascorbate metabolism protein UlaG (beta-lactamase superfamily)